MGSSPEPQQPWNWVALPWDLNPEDGRHGGGVSPEVGAGEEARGTQRPSWLIRPGPRQAEARPRLGLGQAAMLGAGFGAPRSRGPGGRTHSSALLAASPHRPRGASGSLRPARAHGVKNLSPSPWAPRCFPRAGAENGSLVTNMASGHWVMRSLGSRPGHKGTFCSSPGPSLSSLGLSSAPHPPQLPPPHASCPAPRLPGGEGPSAAMAAAILKAALPGSPAAPRASLRAQGDGVLRAPVRLSRAWRRRLCTETRLRQLSPSTQRPPGGPEVAGPGRRGDRGSKGGRWRPGLGGQGLRLGPRFRPLVPPRTSSRENEHHAHRVWPLERAQISPELCKLQPNVSEMGRQEARQTMEPASAL